MIDLEECFAKGMLRKTAPSMEQAILIFNKAGHALDDARANLEEERYDATILLAYQSLLSASKAILFMDGIREKSHVCIARYLEAKHNDKFDLQTIGLLDSFREARHEIQYSAAFTASENQAKEIVEFAEKFLGKVGAIINKK